MIESCLICSSMYLSFSAVLVCGEVRTYVINAGDDNTYGVPRPSIRFCISVIGHKAIYKWTKLGRDSDP